MSNIVSTPGVLSQPATLTVLADSDQDGLPDVFESAYGLNPFDPSDAVLDSDHDGLSNAEEYLAGTDPSDPLSLVKVDQIHVGDRTTIEFTAAASKTYTVQFRDSSADGPWRKLADVPALSFRRTVSIDDSEAPPRRFYRLVTPTQL